MISLRVSVFVSVLLVSSLSASPAAAVVGGSTDGNSHPYVGAIDLRPAGYNLVASGVLVSPTVMVTAGHVTSFFEHAGLTRAHVTFDSVVGAFSTWYWGTVHTDPIYNPTKEQPMDDPDDLGVIVFDVPITGVSPAVLPPAGLLDHLGDDKKPLPPMQEVGYGTSEHVGNPNDRGLAAWSGDGTRKLINGLFKGTHGGWLTMTPTDGEPCYGDSGGPMLLGNIVAGVLKLTSNGNFCEGDALGMRLDTPEHRSFLGAYVSLP